MELQLFNSLENKITKLNLQSGQTINIYLCGPTVYDHIHVGNLRPVIIFDVLCRLLLHLNVKVNYIQNITDIDDKIIAKAQKEKRSEKQISQHYTKAYFDNLIRYNVLFPSHSPRVTNYLPQIKKFIASLVEKGAAYQQAGEVCFCVEKNQEYGKLSGQKLKKLKNVREITQTNKVDSKDFLLWKKTEKGISWSSPWGKGRPGWHTECAVFIQEFLAGQTLDIHGGGNDLLFPHHENERIQYLANNNRELSKIWLHIAHIHWKEEKMSKSLGNVISAKYFAKKYDPNVFRYLILNSKYNQVINLNEALIQQANDYVQKIKNLIKRINFYLYTKNMQIDFQKQTDKPQIIEHLLSNLNTIKALYDLEIVINLINKELNKEKKEQDTLENIRNFYFILDILGFKFDVPIYSFKVKSLIANWEKSRKNGEYSQADKIRNSLQKNGIL